jgi:DNA-binding NtrC family response regulator
VSANILVIDDEDIMREYVEESLVRAGHSVRSVSSGKEGLASLKSGSFDLVVTDLKMAPMDGLEVVRRVRRDPAGPRCIVMTAYGTIETAVQAMKNGAEDYILKPFTPDELELAVSRAIERAKLAEENRYLRNALNEPFRFDAMVGDSALMQTVHDQIRKVACSKSTVLIRGESGTGKELVARAIHYTGDRKDKPFIKVNCAALSAGVLESELFGHEKGSFTGAHDRKIGRFELADGGTLLLDEVSEMSTDLQPKLLRALQEREIDRVGGNRPIPVDTRIIATSNRDLERAVEHGTFREDLFFRLSVIPIQLPPLRARREDIPPLLDHFVDHFCRENGRANLKIEPAAREALVRYEWPGNVRELQNAIERAVVLAGSDRLTADDFPVLTGRAAPSTNGHGPGVRVGATVAEMEKELILRTLESCGDNRTRAAEVLQISVRTLRNKLKEYREQEAKTS